MAALFFHILVALLPCTITGKYFMRTTGTCEKLPGEWRDIESLDECIEANSYLLGWDFDPTDANDNSDGPSWAPCGCTYHEQGTIDFWGDESTGSCNPKEKCTGFRDDDDLGCFCYSDEYDLNEATLVDGGPSNKINFGDEIAVKYDFWKDKKEWNVILQKKKPNTRKARRNTQKRSHKSARKNRTVGCKGKAYGAQKSEEDTIRGTFEEDEDFAWETMFYQHTCADVADYINCAQAKSKGQLKFDVNKGQSFDDSSDDDNVYPYFWPPSDGEWRACPSDRYHSEQGKCDLFTIKPISGKNLKKAKVSSAQPEYDVNDPIKVKFENKKQYDNVWVGIYDKDQMMLDIVDKGKNNKPKHKFSYYAWAFTGCETTIGDEDNGSCSTIVNKGALELPPIGSGEYYLCISLDFDEDTQDNIKCTKKSFSISGENTVIKHMKPKYDFDEKFDVVWSNPKNPDGSNYFIHVYIQEQVDEHRYGNKYRNLAFRKSACIEIEPGSKSCDEPLKHGSFVFSEKTSRIAQNFFAWLRWPIPSGDYQACLVNEAEDSDEIISCERFTIDPLSDDVINAAEVTLDKELFERYEDITGSYVTPLKATANMWLAVYSADDIQDGKPKDNGADYIEYVVACGDDDRDSPFDPCPFRDKEGDFRFESTSYLCAGKYRICLLFDENFPYLYIKCSEEFEIFDPPTPTPTEAPTPAPTSVPGNSIFN